MGKNKELIKYFTDLEQVKITKHSGVISASDPNITLIEKVNGLPTGRQISRYSIMGTPYYYKNDRFMIATSKSHEIGSSKMYRDLGIVTPQVYPMSVRNNKLSRQIGLITQDVNSLPNITPTIASDIKEYAKLHIPHDQNLSYLDILYNKKIREYCLTFMTEDCLEELASIFILGELRTDGDINQNNYFLYKKAGSDKYNGVIVIDLECSNAMALAQNSKESFDYFVKKMVLQSCIPFRDRAVKDKKAGEYEYKIYTYDATHADRLIALLNAIHKGTLSSKQISLIKRAINYDLPKTMRDATIEHHLNKEKKYPDIVARLWDYNHEILDKEL